MSLIHNRNIFYIEKQSELNNVQAMDWNKGHLNKIWTQIDSTNQLNAYNSLNCTKEASFKRSVKHLICSFTPQGKINKKVYHRKMKEVCNIKKWVQTLKEIKIPAFLSWIFTTLASLNCTVSKGMGLTVS